jgi:hypothetical protein
MFARQLLYPLSNLSSRFGKLIFSNIHPGGISEEISSLACLFSIPSVFKFILNTFTMVCFRAEAVVVSSLAFKKIFILYSFG